MKEINKRIYQTTLTYFMREIVTASYLTVLDFNVQICCYLFAVKLLKTNQSNWRPAVE